VEQLAVDKKKEKERNKWKWKWTSQPLHKAENRKNEGKNITSAGGKGSGSCKLNKQETT